MFLRTLKKDLGTRYRHKKVSLVHALLFKPLVQCFLFKPAKLQKVYVFLFSGGK